LGLIQPVLKVNCEKYDLSFPIPFIPVQAPVTLSQSSDLFLSPDLHDSGGRLTLRIRSIMILQDQYEQKMPCNEKFIFVEKPFSPLLPLAPLSETTTMRVFFGIARIQIHLHRSFVTNS
jgi:hypothetical protein